MSQRERDNERVNEAPRTAQPKTICNQVSGRLPEPPSLPQGWKPDRQERDLIALGAFLTPPPILTHTPTLTPTPTSAVAHQLTARDHCMTLLWGRLTGISKIS